MANGKNWSIERENLVIELSKIFSKERLNEIDTKSPGAMQLVVDRLNELEFSVFDLDEVS